MLEDSCTWENLCSWKFVRDKGANIIVPDGKTSCFGH